MTDPVPVAEQAQPRRRRIPVWFIVLVVIMLGLLLFGDRGLLRVLQAQRQQDELQAQITKLEATNAELRRQIELLQNDLHTIESIARRELGMVRPDEMVYQFPTEPKTPPPVAPPQTGSQEPPSQLDSPSGRR